MQGRGKRTPKSFFHVFIIFTDVMQSAMCTVSTQQLDSQSCGRIRRLAAMLHHGQTDAMKTALEVALILVKTEIL